MFLINRENNSIEKVSETTFTQLGFKERYNLQEWIANKPEALGEDLLIIQKEFSGFDETNERLDLLALDKQGNIVVIENKLDDSGRDVVWQCLKYASYSSSLKKSQILKIFQEYLNSTNPGMKAEEAISEFLDGAEIEEINLNQGITQRLMFVSGSYRKEVTSTVMWLLNYGIRIQCFQVTPYCYGDQPFLNIEQIIPLKQAEEYSISMAEKTQEAIASQEEMKNRHVVRLKFWERIINEMNQKSDLYKNISPSKYHWIGAGSGIRGVGYNFVASKNYGRAELYIDRGERSENKFIFDQLSENRSEIENKFGDNLEWDELEGRRSFRIKFEDKAFNIFENQTWSRGISTITEAMVKLEKTLKPYLKELNKKLKSSSIN